MVLSRGSGLSRLQTAARVEVEHVAAAAALTQVSIDGPLPLPTLAFELSSSQKGLLPSPGSLHHRLSVADVRCILSFPRQAR